MLSLCARQVIEKTHVHRKRKDCSTILLKCDVRKGLRAWSWNIAANSHSGCQKQRNSFLWRRRSLMLVNETMSSWFVEVAKQSRLDCPNSALTTEKIYSARISLLSWFAAIRINKGTEMYVCIGTRSACLDARLRTQRHANWHTLIVLRTEWWDSTRRLQNQWERSRSRP